MDIVLQRHSGSEEEYQANFRLSAHDTLEDVLALYDQVASETEEIVAGIADLGHPVPVPSGVPWFPDDVEAWSLRWVLLHLIEETARHAGHADIVRESIDGATAYPLMAAAEGWPASPWIRPWEPARSRLEPGVSSRPGGSAPGRTASRSGPAALRRDSPSAASGPTIRAGDGCGRCRIYHP